MKPHSPVRVDSIEDQPDHQHILQTMGRIRGILHLASLVALALRATFNCIHTLFTPYLPFCLVAILLDYLPPPNATMLKFHFRLLQVRLPLNHVFSTNSGAGV